MAEGTGRAGPPARLAVALLLSASAAAWATSFAGGLQFDDWNVIAGDARVASLAAWWRAMPGLRPLAKLSWALDGSLGLGLPGFHATSLAIHLGAALLALRLLARLELAFTAGDVAPGRVPWAALLGALLFALHPAQVEAVTYLSGRPAALAGLLALGSALCWLRGREAGRPLLVHLASPLLYAAALGAKESAAPLPAALLLLAAAGPGRAPAALAWPAAAQAVTVGWRAALRDLAGHGLVLAAAAAAFLASPGYRAMLGHAGTLRAPLQNLRAHLEGLAWLAGQALRPDLLLADPGLAAAEGPWWPAAALAALGVAALLAGGLAALLLGPRAPLGLGATPGRRAAALGALWLLCWLPPSGWILPRPEAANARQLYLPLLGPAWLLGRGLAAGLAAPRWRLAAAGLSLALVAALGVATARRSLVYADEVTYWADVAVKAPANPRAFNNLGLALSAACRLEEAEAAFEAALALDPGHPRARVNLWLLRQGEPPGERPGEPPRCPAPPRRQAE